MELVDVVVSQFNGLAQFAAHQLLGLVYLCLTDS